jgi:prepilin-type N-terminal cleavage/methylation domain-containing protein
MSARIRGVRRALTSRRAFTLVELLVAIAIIGILAGLVLAAFHQSGQRAREARTRSIIQKLDRAILTRWESYRTRRVSVPPVDDENGDGSLLDGGGPTERAETALLALGFNDTPGDPFYMRSPRASAALRLAAIRELQRFELPQRYADVTDTPLIIDRPAVSQAYARQLAPVIAAGGENRYQAAEMLYLIVTSGGIEDDPLGEDHFRHDDVADVDGNGLHEFVDGYGSPIRFLRWAPGFVSDLQPPPDTTDADSVAAWCAENHDPFDPMRVDSPPLGSTTPTGYRLFPLIYSAGPDYIYDVRVGATAATFATAADYGAAIYTTQIGLPEDSENFSPGTILTGPIGSGYPADGEVGAFDNIHNHTTTQSIR